MAANKGLQFSRQHAITDEHERNVTVLGEQGAKCPQ
jgi:hypothetical protein